MSNTKNNGGPAFPVTLSEHQTMASHHANGMTLRDYFAAKAMAVAIGHALDAITDKDLASAIELVPRFAYGMADAMLKAREQ